MFPGDALAETSAENRLFVTPSKKHRSTQICRRRRFAQGIAEAQVKHRSATCFIFCFPSLCESVAGDQCSADFASRASPGTYFSTQSSARAAPTTYVVCCVVLAYIRRARGHPLLGYRWATFPVSAILKSFFVGDAAVNVCVRRFRRSCLPCCSTLECSYETAPRPPTGLNAFDVSVGTAPRGR